MRANSHRSILGPLLMAVALTLLPLFAAPGMAQTAAPPPPQAATLSAQQLDDLVAPIALYPDPLLSQVLVAATYPLELVEARQWLDRHRELTGSAAVDAARDQNWDASVQALIAMPDVVATLTQDIQWTTALGNAFLAQQQDVMSAVQRMRASAQARGKLSSTPQQVVTEQTQGGQTAIAIQPASQDVIYVPAYDPMYVWGPPAYGYYPPLLYPAYGFGFGPALNIGFCFGSWGFWGGWGGWGWGPNWFGHTVIVNNAFFGHYGFHGYAGGYGRYPGTALWTHNPSHRLGVPYPNRQLAGRYGSASMAAGRAQRFSGGYVGAYGGGRNFARQSRFSGSQRGYGSGVPGGRNGFVGARPAYGGGPSGFAGRQNSAGGGRSMTFSGQGYRPAGPNAGAGRA